MQLLPPAKRRRSQQGPVAALAAPAQPDCTRGVCLPPASLQTTVQVTPATPTDDAQQTLVDALLDAADEPAAVVAGLTAELAAAFIALPSLPTGKVSRGDGCLAPALLCLPGAAAGLAGIARHLQELGLRRLLQRRQYGAAAALLRTAGVSLPPSLP